MAEAFSDEEILEKLIGEEGAYYSFVKDETHTVFESILQKGIELLSESLTADRKTIADQTAEIERLRDLVNRVSILMRWEEMDKSLDLSEIAKVFPKNLEDSKKDIMNELRQALDVGKEK